MPDSRYIHHTDLRPGTPAYVQGQKQTEIALERFHYLCAAARKQYISLDNIAPDLSRAQLFPRQGLDFSPYQPFVLEPVTGIKLHPRDDGTIHPGDIEVYVDTYRRNWKSREGGILYFVAEAREFWNMILNYHSLSHTTGVREWDILLDKLKVDPDPKLVPCMFFARQAGCLNAACPFLHDKPACQRERAIVLEARRLALGQPTTRDISQRYNQGLAELRSSRSDALVPRDHADLSDDPEMHRLWKERRMIKKICSNPQCLTVKWKSSANVSGNDQPAPVLKACGRCKVTFYCSPECQKTDGTRRNRVFSMKNFSTTTTSGIHSECGRGLAIPDFGLWNVERGSRGPSQTLPLFSFHLCLCEGTEYSCGPLLLLYFISLCN